MITGFSYYKGIIATCVFIGCVSVISLIQNWSSQPVVFAASNEIKESVLTQTRFEHKIITSSKSIDFDIKEETDPNVDKCDEPKIKVQGKKGTKFIDTEITLYNNEELGRRVVANRIQKPESQVIIKGTKVVYKNLKTANGDIQYTCSLGNFRATAYDYRCKGCNEWTAIGMRAGFGVVAVDPKVIPLRSRLYITGYGPAIAGDTGGAIKGKKIDLGFDLIDKSWGVRSVEVYVL